MVYDLQWLTGLSVWLLVSFIITFLYALLRCNDKIILRSRFNLLISVIHGYDKYLNIHQSSKTLNIIQQNTNHYHQQDNYQLSMICVIFILSCLTSRWVWSDHISMMWCHDWWWLMTITDELIETIHWYCWLNWMIMTNRMIRMTSITKMTNMTKWI